MKYNYSRFCYKRPSYVVSAAVSKGKRDPAPVLYTNLLYRYDLTPRAVKYYLYLERVAYGSFHGVDGPGAAGNGDGLSGPFLGRF